MKIKKIQKELMSNKYMCMRFDWIVKDLQEPLWKVSLAWALIWRTQYNKNWLVVLYNWIRIYKTWKNDDKNNNIK